MNNELAIIQQSNVAAISANAPVAFKNNQLSHDRCLDYGKTLLDTIEAAGGMNDELDKQAADYIERSRKTVKKMNEQRSPVTKLFDEIRSVFTSMENDVDPSKQTSIPGKLQKMRNEYAAKKREEAEARRREEERIQRIESAKKKYRSSLEFEFREKLNSVINRQFNELCRLNASVTLDNYSDIHYRISQLPVELTDDMLKSIFSNPYASRPVEVDSSVLAQICNSTAYELAPKFKEQYRFEMESNRDAILDMLPSKRKELEAIAKSNVEEAARRKLEMERREAEEARRKEEERIRKEQEAQQQAKAQQQQSEMGALFDQASASVGEYQPKTQVKKKIEVSGSRAFLDILNMWWMYEGCNLSVEELSKKFKSQITFCEKLANDKNDPKFIQSEYVRYIDDVKAK